MPATELAVVVLWHMHQPDYRDPEGGRTILPWVRLHACLSYFDMVRLAQETAGARAVFNVVPTLLEQLTEIARGAGDDFLDLARAEPGDLTAEDRALILRRFFAFHHGRRFAELPRLGEIWRKREGLGSGRDAGAAAAFSDAELRDLQVGFHLAWCGRSLREEPLVGALLRKGRRFTAAEKHELLDLQREFVGRVVPAYRQWAASGDGEIACTPWAHPILPLLCDTRSAREAVPNLPLPAVGTRRVGDAFFHVTAALDATERLLGVRPEGMWPAEGGLSQEAVRVFGAAGVRWIGGDQDVLFASLAGEAPPPGGHFQPWRLAGADAPWIFFRDKGLSDRIGFVYGGWQAQQAAADFVGHLQRIRSLLPPGRFVVPIILDGENAWEGYPGNGVDFLRALYAGVAGASGLRWSTFGEQLRAGGAPVPLPRLIAGSWIRRDFTTWIGHPEKNRAWELLARARERLEPRLAAAGALRRGHLPDGTEFAGPDPALADPERDEPLARAWRALAAAQGSDWFWWFGDEHQTEFAAEFDALFRGHLVAAHRLAGEEPPAELAVPVRAGRQAVAGRPPRAPLAVVLDGRVSHYYEWLDAGRCDARGARGAMHQAVSPLAELHYGADDRSLLLRLDPAAEAGASNLQELVVAVHVLPFASAAGLGDGVTARRAGQVALNRGATRLPRADGPQAALERIGEIAFPWNGLGLKPGEAFAFFLTLEREGQAELRVPAAGTLAMRVPVGPGDTEDWIV